MQVRRTSYLSDRARMWVAKQVDRIANDPIAEVKRQIRTGQLKPHEHRSIGAKLDLEIQLWARTQNHEHNI